MEALKSDLKHKQLIAHFNNEHEAIAQIRGGAGCPQLFN